MRHARDDYNRIQDPAGKIPDDEPVFLIRAQDENGWETVMFWAHLAESRGADPAIVAKAKAHAALMMRWPAKKVPDLTCGELHDEGVSHV